MGAFLEKYGLIIITLTAAILMVLIGVLTGTDVATQAGIFLFGGAAGTHVGANTDVVPLPVADAKQAIEDAGGRVKLPTLKP